jgi:hypothetical protein
MGLQLYSEAREAYEKAAKLEPDDQALQHGLNKATGLELQHIRQRKHVFNKGKPGSSQQQRPKQNAGDSNGRAKLSTASEVKQRTKLSFAVHDEEV